MYSGAEQIELNSDHDKLVISTGIGKSNGVYALCL